MYEGFEVLLQTFLTSSLTGGKIIDLQVLTAFRHKEKKKPLADTGYVVWCTP